MPSSARQRIVAATSRSRVLSGRDLTFLHWPYEPAVVQRLLPAGLTVDTHDGRAWVGLVPFVLSVWSGRGAVGARFPETNVRVYVRGPDGVPGVWFLSLDAARTDAVATARLVHRLPYMRARMAADVVDGMARYRSHRVWPHRPAHMGAVGRVGDPIPPEDVGDLDHHLAARFCLYSLVRGRLRRAWAAHEPWPLHRADLLHLDQTLVQAAGLPAPAGEPLVHWSPGVTVRLSRSEPVG